MNDLSEASFRKFQNNWESVFEKVMHVHNFVEHHVVGNS